MNIKYYDGTLAFVLIMLHAHRVKKKTNNCVGT